ncbi:major facilitator superfamily transporter [Diplocarpon rosae]|nr:major facilitator superfamily transporter [Diplocarpon rosae]
MFGPKKETPVAEAQADSGSDVPRYAQNDNDPLADTGKSRWQRIWPAMACGAGLFSDGYVNNVIGSVSTMLSKIYGDAYTGSSAQKNISAITFAGTVVGQLVFGYTSDKWSRKNSLLVSTLILILFTALAAGSYGAGGSVQGMFAALTAYRFLVGIGIGGEYPAGSVACAESTGELKAGTRNRWFILFTNVMIDWGFVIGAFVPCILVVICTADHLRAAWRISLGLGVLPPMILLWLRLKLQEPEEFKQESMKHVKIPYLLVSKYYWWRLFVVSLIWFLYDFSTYSFGIFSSTILANIYGKTAPLTTVFGWNIVINLFYIPGAMLGSFYSDKVGPRYALASGVFVQGIVGFIMAGLYPTLAKPDNVAGFAVVYGIFLSLGELGPGDNIGLVASKTCATGVRGQYYAIAAAIGKIGAFVGTYIFPYIEKAGGKGTNASAQYPFYVSASFCILSAFLAVFCLPHIGQDTITKEDVKFREYLSSKGWDVNQLGLLKGESVESRSAGPEGAMVHEEEKEKKPK